MMRRPARVAIAIAIPVLGGCSGTSGSKDVRAEPGGTEPEWFTNAVAASRETMEMRCDDFAPLEILRTSAPLYVACIGEASMAAIASREKVYRDALSTCISDHRVARPVSCCFRAVTDQHELMLEEQNRCDRECAARTGTQAAHAPDRNRCNPVTVSPPRIERNRAATPAVRQVLALCGPAVDAATRCEQLPSSVERGYCHNACKVREQEFGVAVGLCARNVEHDGVPIRCAIAEERSEACEASCRETLRRHRIEVDAGVR